MYKLHKQEFSHGGAFRKLKAMDTFAGEKKHFLKSDNASVAWKDLYVQKGQKLSFIHSYPSKNACTIHSGEIWEVAEILDQSIILMNQDEKMEVFKRRFSSGNSFRLQFPLKPTKFRYPFSIPISMYKTDVPVRFIKPRELCTKRSP